ncbi:MAG: hypothetical protein NZ473_08385, partial [Candidatus Kapabacteria bacterium]|nr:hypothetical protein [Candidatus Kapabacteria bacterium]
MSEISPDPLLPPDFSEREWYKVYQRASKQEQLTPSARRAVEDWLVESGVQRSAEESAYEALERIMANDLTPEEAVRIIDNPSISQRYRGITISEDTPALRDIKENHESLVSKGLQALEGEIVGRAVQTLWDGQEGSLRELVGGLQSNKQSANRDVERLLQNPETLSEYITAKYRRAPEQVLSALQEWSIYKASKERITPTIKALPPGPTEETPQRVAAEEAPPIASEEASTELYKPRAKDFPLLSKYKPGGKEEQYIEAVLQRLLNPEAPFPVAALEDARQEAIRQGHPEPHLVAARRFFEELNNTPGKTYAQKLANLISSSERFQTPTEATGPTTFQQRHQAATQVYNFVAETLRHARRLYLEAAQKQVARATKPRPKLKEKIEQL